MRDSLERLSPLTIGLHWIVAVFIIGMVALGIYMDEFEVGRLYPIHKSLGVIAFVVIVPRVIWRAMNGWPQPVSQYKVWEQRLSKVVHWLLLIGMVLFPVSGMLMSGLGGHGVPLFGLELVPMNPDPANPQKMLPINGDMAKLAGGVHGLLGNLFIVLISLHVLGALKHHFLDGDRTLHRMVGK